MFLQCGRLYISPLVIEVRAVSRARQLKGVTRAGSTLTADYLTGASGTSRAWQAGSTTEQAATKPGFRLGLPDTAQNDLIGHDTQFEDSI